MKVIQQILQAGVRTEFAEPGRFFMLTDASQCDVEFIRRGAIAPEKATAVQTGYKSFPGDWRDVDANRFDGFAITSVATQTIEIAISENAGDYLRFVSVVQLAQPTSGTTSADQSIDDGDTDTINGDSTYRAMYITADPTNTGYLRVGAQAGAGKGQWLPAGGTAVFPGTYDVLVHNESGDDGQKYMYEIEVA